MALLAPMYRRPAITLLAAACALSLFAGAAPPAAPSSTIMAAQPAPAASAAPPSGPAAAAPPAGAVGAAPGPGAGPLPLNGRSLEAKGPVDGPMPGGTPESDALVRQADDLRRHGDLPGALAKAQAAIKLVPRHPDGLLLLGVIEDSMQHFQDAAGHLKLAVELQPKNAFARKAYASALVESHDADGAAKAIAPLLAVKPIDTQAYGLAAQIAAAQGDFDGAKRHLDTIFKADPNNVPAHVLGARIAMARHQTAVARTHLQAIIKVQPDGIDAIMGLASLEANDGHLPEAVALLAKARKAQPKAPTPLVASAEMALLQRHVDEASGYVSTLETLAPGSVPALALRAQVLFAQHRPKDAVAPLQAAFAKQPIPELLVQLYQALEASGQQPEADRQLTSWLQAHPDDLKMRFFAGETAAHHGDYAAASGHFQAILAKDPQNALVLTNLAQSLEGQHDPKAVETAEKAYKIRPDDPLTENSLGGLLMAHGEAGRGLSLLRDAAGHSAQNPDFRYDYAVALAISGDKAQARKEIEAILALKRPFAHEAQAREMLKGLSGS